MFCGVQHEHVNDSCDVVTPVIKAFWWPDYREFTVAKYNEMAQLRRLLIILAAALISRWILLPHVGGNFNKKTVNENMFLKLVLSVEGVDVMETYRKLGDYRARKKWDFLSKYVMEPIKGVLSASHCAQFLGNRNSEKTSHKLLVKDIGNPLKIRINMGKTYSYVRGGYP